MRAWITGAWPAKSATTKAAPRAKSRAWPSVASRQPTRGALRCPSSPREGRRPAGRLHPGTVLIPTNRRPVRAPDSVRGESRRRDEKPRRTAPVQLGSQADPDCPRTQSVGRRAPRPAPPARLPQGAAWTSAAGTAHRRAEQARRSAVARPGVPGPLPARPVLRLCPHAPSLPPATVEGFDLRILRGNEAL